MLLHIPVGQVMKYLKTLGSNENLSLKLMSMKNAILIALVSADRGATVTSLDLTYMIKSSSEVTFLVAKSIKTTRPGSGVKEIVLKRYLKGRKTSEVFCLAKLQEKSNTHFSMIDILAYAPRSLELVSYCLQSRSWFGRGNLSFAHAQKHPRSPGFASDFLETSEFILNAVRSATSLI